MLGNFATSVIAGVVVFGTLRLTGVPFAAALAIWVGIVDFLPLVGGLLAGVPTVALAALHSLTAGIVTLVVFLVYQQIENHILNPLVMSRTVRLNPLWVLLAILVGAELGDFVGSTFGALVGALLAVPTAERDSGPGSGYLETPRPRTSVHRHGHRRHRGSERRPTAALIARRGPPWEVAKAR